MRDYEYKRLVKCNRGGQIVLNVNDGLGRVSNGPVFLIFRGSAFRVLIIRSYVLTSALNRAL